MSQEKGNLSLSSLLTGLVAVLGVAGVVAQIVAYAAAKRFYGLFGLDLVTVGITPLNAAWRLSGSAVSALAGQLKWIGPLVAVILAISILRNIRDALTDTFVRNEREARDELSRLDASDPHGVRHVSVRMLLRETIQNHQSLIDRRSRSVLNRALKILDLSRATIVGVIGLWMITGAVGVYVDAIRAAQMYAAELQSTKDSDRHITDLQLQFDLRPHAVLVQWTDKDKVPTVLRSMEDRSTYFALEMGQTDNRIVLWFRDLHMILTLESSDVVLTRVTR